MLSANNGDLDAQCELGYQYYQGNNVTKNDQVAFDWFARAANQDHTRSQAIIAHFYAAGVVVQQNFEKSFYWHSKAAENKLPHSQFQLGLYYKEGFCTDKDLNKAIDLFTQAAEQNVAEAQLELGLMYTYGTDVEKDPNLAFKWISKAVELKLSKAYPLMGNLYFYGIGTSKNLEEGLKYYRLGADDGDPISMFNLSQFYLDEQGIYFNKELGIDYLTRAAQNHLVVAQKDLAFIYRPYTGLESNRIKYYYWLRMAWHGKPNTIHHNTGNKTLDVQSDILQSLYQDTFKESTYHYNVLKKNPIPLQNDPDLLVDQFPIFDAIKIKEDDELLDFFMLSTINFALPREDGISDETWDKGVKIRLEIENVAFMRLVNQYNQLRNPANPAAQELIDKIIDSAQEPHAQHLSAEQVGSAFTTLYEYWNYGLITTGMSREEDVENLKNLVTVILSFTRARIDELSQEHRLMLASMLLTTLSFNTKQLNLSIKNTLTAEQLIRLCTIFEEENWDDGRYKSYPDAQIQSRVLSSLSTLAYQPSQRSIESEYTNKLKYSS